MRKNRFIIFEGIDGVGKTTQLRRLAEKIKFAGHQVLETKEPGSPYIKLRVRDFILSHEKVDPAALELMLWADRAEHTQMIQKHLYDWWIVSDRSYISGFAYGMACGHKFDDLVAISKFAIHQYPDHVFMLDIDPAVAKERLTTNTREEAKGIEFAQKVRENMKWVLGSQHQTPHVRFNILDGTLPEDELADQIAKAIPV